MQSKERKEIKPNVVENGDKFGIKSIHQSVLESPWEESVLMEARGYLFCALPLFLKWDKY